MKEVNTYVWEWIIHNSFNEGRYIRRSLINNINQLLTNTSVRPYSTDELTDEIGEILL